MKSTLLKLISAASITAFSLLGSLPASAQAKNMSNCSVTPFSLVSQAQSGRLKNQGVPSYGAFKTQYMFEK